MKIQKLLILSIDFDGVIHSYTSRWQGVDVIPDMPVPGAFEALQEYSKYFRVCIYSSRSSTPAGIAAMKYWFKQHGYPCDSIGEPAGLEFPTEKPPAWVTIDDRCVRFKGTFPKIDYLKNFKPWNKK